MNELRASPAFAFTVLLTLVLYGLIGVVLLHPALVSSVLGHDVAGHVSGHFRFPHHRVHDITFGLVVGSAAVGALVQLRSPSANVAGQWMALIAWLALALIAVVTASFVFAPLPVFAGLTLLAAILHPARRNAVGSLTWQRVDRVMLALVMIAAVPLLVFAASNIGLQRTLTNDHAQLGHYGFMAAFSFTVIGAGIVASLRPSGWRLTAWVTGSVVALFGLVSLLYAALDSSLSMPWAIAAIIWGIAFVATGNLRSRS